MRPHGKFAVVDPTDPSALAICDRCGKMRNLVDLRSQIEWAGQHLFDIQTLACKDTCFDTPNEQLRTIILPPDPPPVLDARPPNFIYEETGPVQSTLSSNVAQGALTLSVVSVEGFEVGNLVWVQLNNANFAQMEVSAVDTDTNVLTITEPLPFSAPFTGSVTVSNVGS